MSKQLKLKVSVPHKNERLDRFVCNCLENYSRGLIQSLIKEKQILVNEKASKAGYKLSAGDVISVFIPDLKKSNVQPENIRLDVLYEDNELIVVNKPAGMITHPLAGVYEGTLVNALLYHCKNSLSGINGVLRPGIVHRLDKDTSGLIIACKSDMSHNEIAKQIKERSLKRSYLAIAHGKVQYDKGTINKPIGRDRIHRHKMAVVSGGKNAITHWRVLKKVETRHGASLQGDFTLLECTLETGRTHQIRVHLASFGHPIVGDKTYGKKNDKEDMMLHAYKLVFKHPKTKKEIELKIDIPERFLDFLKQ